ncbi:MAG: 2-amino-4-hydroxy-6-hydroxymethyldihydropteridine diphosphokinase [Paracoccaceae bacterium]
MHHIALIALGSNQPFGQTGPEAIVHSALTQFHAFGLCVSRVSRFFVTPCFPAGAGPDFVNAAVAVRTGLDAPGILKALHRIETDMGRNRPSRWAPRTLDLDLIAVGDLVLPDAAGHQQWRDLPPEHQASLAPDQLILPHPRVQDRGFVLVPLADIAADWVHPVLGRSVADMVAALPAKDRADVRAL